MRSFYQFLLTYRGKLKSDNKGKLADWPLPTTAFLNKRQIIMKSAITWNGTARFQMHLKSLMNYGTSMTMNEFGQRH